MMNQIFARVMGAALLLGIAGVASAQSNCEGLSLRIGQQWPNKGDQHLALGADYKLPIKTMSASNLFLGFSADHYGSTTEWIIPVAVTANYQYKQFKLSAGGGVDIYKYAGHNTSALGGQVALDYDLFQAGQTDTPFFIEAKYFFTHEHDLSGFAAFVGYRF